MNYIKPFVKPYDFTSFIENKAGLPRIWYITTHRGKFKKNVKEISMEKVIMKNARRKAKNE